MRDRTRTTRPDTAERVTATLPRPLARRLRVHARSTGRSVSSILREALEGYLEGLEPPGMPSFTGVGASGRSDLSERVEELLAEHFGHGPER